MDPKKSVLAKKIFNGLAVPWLWLNDDETQAQDNREADGKGGAILVRDYNNGGPAIFIPKVMEHAPELLEALRLALTALNTAPRFNVDKTTSYNIAGQIEKLIKKVEDK